MQTSRTGVRTPYPLSRREDLLRAFGNWWPQLWWQVTAACRSPTAHTQRIAGNSVTQRPCDPQAQGKKRACERSPALGVKGQRAGSPQQSHSRVC